MKITRYTVYAVLHCDFLPCLQHLMRHNLGPVWHRPSSLHQACKTSISCYRIIALYNCGAFKSIQGKYLQDKFHTKLWGYCGQTEIFHKNKWNAPLPDQCVDLCHINVIQLLDSFLDLWLVWSFVHYEYQGVVVFDLLHGRLSCKGELHNAEPIQPETDKKNHRCQHHQKQRQAS